MSAENNRDRDKMRLFVQGRDSRIDDLIDETELQLANTRLFLDRIATSENQTREHIKHYKDSLQRDLDRLRRERRNADR